MRNAEYLLEEPKENKIKINHIECEVYEVADWIHVAHYDDQLRTLVNTLMNLWLLK